MEKAYSKLLEIMESLIDQYPALEYFKTIWESIHWAFPSIPVSPSFDGVVFRFSQIITCHFRLWQTSNVSSDINVFLIILRIGLFFIRSCYLLRLSCFFRIMWLYLAYIVPLSSSIIFFLKHAQTAYRREKCYQNVLTH